ncbi:hypothetical protein OSK03_27720, partial [Escherichia coli]|nr:hypothetical protein [Escherichia coli]
GPLLFGGFSFDPYQKKDSYWTDFSNSKFVIPSVLYTEADGNGYLSINIKVSGEDNIQDHLKHIEEFEGLLINQEYDGSSYSSPLL